MAPVPPELIEPFRRAPRRAAVLVDFDGTLAPIVEDADRAIPLPGAAEVLARLAATFGMVGVISGRPVSYLEKHLPGDLCLNGLYGLESSDGIITRHPAAARWQPVVDEVAAAAADDALPELQVEHKGLSLTLHYRSHPEHAGAVLAWASTQAARSGLELREAKMSVELHPPVAVDKGTTLEELAAGLGGRPASSATTSATCPPSRPSTGWPPTAWTALRVAVATSESVSTMVERADLLVDGPEGAVAFLQALLP